jgi:hypothetical protein
MTTGFSPNTGNFLKSLQRRENGSNWRLLPERRKIHGYRDLFFDLVMQTGEP